MKNLYFLIIFFNSILLFSQNEIKGSLIKINEQNGYSFLNSVLKNKKIILLGEQSHGEGAVFDEKINIIKYLHENLGFNTIVFESGMYDNYKACSNFKSKKETTSIYNNAIGGLWSDTNSFENLLKYIENCAKKNDTIKILGFDCQESSIFNNNYLNELENTLKKYRIKVSKNTLENLEKSFISKDFDFFINNKKDFTALSNDFENIINSFTKIPNLSVNDKLIQQVFLSAIADFNFEMAQFQNQKIVVQNPRDEQMAKNLIFLSNLYPKEKMICWGASYHFAKNLESISFDETSGEYLQKFADFQKNNTGFSDYKPEDGQKLLNGALPMGKFLKDFFKEKIYSIAFSSFEGDFGLVGDSKTSPILTPPANSIENKLSTLSKAFFEFDLTDTTFFYSSILGNIPFKNKWHSSFDALIFIKKSYKPKFRTYEKGNFITNKTNNYKISGKIVDIKNNAPILNTEITIVDTNINFLLNKNAIFTLTLENNQLDKKIIISAPDYISDTISIGNLIRLKKKFLNVKLKKLYFNGIVLDEVKISNENELSPTAIVKKARNNIELNYFQKPFNQDFYFKSEYYKNDDNLNSIQALIKTYLPNGMNGSENPDTKIYAELMQYKISENKIKQDFYSFGILFNRDLVLSKSNVIYRPESYSLQNEGEMIYENEKVYKISFYNNSPGSYSTGYGYPAPLKSIGFMLISSIDFAVLKYEHCVQRTPYELKDKKILNSTHKIIATYKKFNNKYFINELTEINDNLFQLNFNEISPILKTKSIKTIKSNQIFDNKIELINRPILKLLFEDNLKNNNLENSLTKINYEICNFSK